MVPYNVAYLGNGHFHKGVAGNLYVEQRAGLRALADAIGSGPAALKLSDDMLGLAWGKLLINLNNAVNALSGRTLRDELKARDYRRVFAASIREGLDLSIARRSSRPPSGRSRRASCRGSSIRPTGCSTASSLSVGRSTPGRARRWRTISQPGARPRSNISTASWCGLPAPAARCARQSRDRRAGAPGGGRRGAAPPKALARRC